MVKDALHSEIATLRARVEYLEAENESLRASPAVAVTRLMARFRLSRVQARILECLARGGTVNVGFLIDHASLSGATTPNNISVQITRMRGLIAPVVISNQWGAGYYLDPSSLATVRAVMRGEL